MWSALGASGQMHHRCNNYRFKWFATTFRTTYATFGRDFGCICGVFGSKAAKNPTYTAWDGWRSQPRPSKSYCKPLKLKATTFRTAYAAIPLACGPAQAGGRRGWSGCFCTRVFPHGYLCTRGKKVTCHKRMKWPNRPFVLARFTC